MSRDYTEITDEQLRAINKRAIEQPSYEQLREQNRVLREALECAEYAIIHPASDQTFALRALQDALTATSQEGQHG